MKLERLQEILSKAQHHFSAVEVEISDGYISLLVKEQPTQEQIDSIPTAEYEENTYSSKTYRYLRIWGE